MISDKPSINILTSLLIEHDIDNAVLCPGSRNAAICHNLVECNLRCFGITDERCAGFYAIGMALADQRPAVVCVTSGSALLNLLPAVAEAAYRHIPMIVVSADRPIDRIGQNDGQTIPQLDALAPFAKMSVDVPEPEDETELKYCNRLINQAICESSAFPPGVTHINMRLSEPLHNLKEDDSKYEPILEIRKEESIDISIIDELSMGLCSAKRPLIVLGQLPYSSVLIDAIDSLSMRFTVLCESTSAGYGSSHFDLVLANDGDNPELQPDYVVYAGGTFVSKRIKEFLSKSRDALVTEISPDGQLHDLFSNTTQVIKSNPAEVLLQLSHNTHDNYIDSELYYELWEEKLDEASIHCQEFQPSYSQALAVKTFEDLLSLSRKSCTVHYGNSSSIRLGDLYSTHYNYVNRGVNGIEGSLSVAAGFSLIRKDLTFCVIGDLSFFYDSNALWCDDLKPNLRILLLNNGEGAVFRYVKGLNTDKRSGKFIKGHHRASAKGICASYGIKYDSVDCEEELDAKIFKLINGKSTKPMLLEVFTDAKIDAENYINCIRY